MSSLKVSWLPPKYHHNQCWETTRTQYFSKKNSKWPSMRWIRNVDVLTYMHQSHWIHDIFALLGGNEKNSFFLKKNVFFPNYGKNLVFRFPPKKNRYKLHQVGIWALEPEASIDSILSTYSDLPQSPQIFTKGDNAGGELGGSDSGDRWEIDGSIHHMLHILGGSSQDL